MSDNTSKFEQYYAMVFSKIMFNPPLQWMISLLMFALLANTVGVPRTITVSVIAGFLLCYFLGVWKKWYKPELLE